MQLDRTAHVSVAKAVNAKTRLLTLSLIEITFSQCTIFLQGRFCDACEKVVKAGSRDCSSCLVSGRCKDCLVLSNNDAADTFYCLFCSTAPEGTQLVVAATTHLPSSTPIEANHGNAKEIEKKAETQAAKMQLNFLFRGLSSLWTKMMDMQVEILVPFPVRECTFYVCTIL